MPKNRPPRAIDLRPSGSTSGAVVTTGGGSVTVNTDHGALSGLGDDDHTHYHTDARGDARYVPLARTVSTGNGLTGGGALSANLTLSVLAGAGLTFSGSDLAVGAGAGLTVNADDVALTTPGTLTVTSTNSASGSHTHAVTASDSVSSAQTALLKATLGALTLDALTATTRVRTPLVDTASGNLVLDAAGNQVTVNPSNNLRTDNYASQTTGWAVDYNGAGDFRYLYTDEMHAKSFIADLEQALAGGQVIAKSVALLSRAFTAPAAGGQTALWVRDLPSAPDMQVFQTGDYIRLRQFSRSGGSLTIADCWGTVSNPSTAASGEQSWTFDRSAGGNEGAMAAGTVIPADAIVLDYGVAGNGIYEVNAIDGAYGVNSPYAQVVTHSGHPATTQSVRVRMGNLEGVATGAGYGLFAGSSASGDGNLLATADGVKLRSGTTDMIVLDSSGASYFAGPMTIGTDGEIRQGTGAATFTPGNGNYVGLRMWRDSNVGRIGGYGADGTYTGGVLHWYGATDGKFYFAGGDGRLDADGINLAVGSAEDTRYAYTFRTSSTEYGGMFGYASPSIATTSLVARNTSTQRPLLYLMGEGNSSHEGRVLLMAVGPDGSNSFQFFTDPCLMEIEIGGLNVASATSSLWTTHVAAAFAATLTLTGSTPALNVGSSNVSTGDAIVNIGQGRTGDGNSWLDLVGDTNYTTYGLRIIRYGGQNGNSKILHRGTGNLTLEASDAAQVALVTSGTARLRVAATGEVGIGKTPTSGVELDVSGDIAASGKVYGVIRFVGGSAPASRTDDGGELGDARVVGTYLYIKTATSGNRWTRWQGDNTTW